MNEDKYIVNGNDFWPPFVLEGLEPHYFSGQKFDYYTGVPANLYEALKNNAARIPDSCCITDDTGISYTYSKLLELVDDFANVLFCNYNVSQNSHVALLLYNSIEFCVAFLAIAKLRGVMIPLPTKYRKEEVLSLIDKSDLAGIICDQEFCPWFHQTSEMNPYFMIGVDSGTQDCGLPRFDGTQPELPSYFMGKPEDHAVIMFTSGTTSLSKGVVITNYNFMHAISVYQKIFDITDRDSCIIPVPIYHVTGLAALFGLFLYAGGQIRLHRYFNAGRVLYDVEKYDITVLHGAPTVFSLLLEQAENFPCLPSLRLFACGSGNMPRQNILKLHAWLPHVQFRTVYGLTETSSPAAIFPDDAALSEYIGSSGYPIPGTQFKICDESGKILPLGEVGSIFIKGTVVLSSYYHLETKLLQDGWLDTGDLGYFTEQGFLYIADRKKDMINRGGEKVWSFDVENTLYSLGGIREAAVVGIPDAVYGEVPAAMIALSPDSNMTSTDIQELLKDKLAKFQIPVKIRIVETLPMTPNSKVDKLKIKSLLT